MVERIDYSSDEEFQQALWAEEEMYLQWAWEEDEKNRQATVEEIERSHNGGFLLTSENKRVS